MDIIAENIASVIENMNAAKERFGRESKGVLLVAVTKTRTPKEINHAIDRGVTDIGENRVQELLDKYEHIKPVRWHMIGHLQTNKVKYIIDKVSLIHSVDSLRLAKEIQKRVKSDGSIMDILIQVNAALEESKFGVSVEKTEELIRTILKSCENIRIKGLMSIVPYAENPEDVRVFFRKVKELYDACSRIEHENLDFQYLSMGMSNDYEVAIEEGANVIRVGSSIFGPRSY